MGVTRRVVRGTAGAIAAVLLATGTGTVINTAYIERLNATFRARVTPLVRRGRAIARTEATLEAGMFLVGCAYNFCWEHESLRQAAAEGAGRKWQERTPAMAAGSDGSSVDHAGVVELSGPAVALGRSQASGATTQAEESAGNAGGSLITVQCGATLFGAVRKLKVPITTGLDWGLPHERDGRPRGPLRIRCPSPCSGMRAADRHFASPLVPRGDGTQAPFGPAPALPLWSIR